MGEAVRDGENQRRAARRERAILASIALCAALATYAGWRTFWFLTDDAFIAFRYASNSLLGRGYVWNQAPFAPVEGYTSFLWTFLLRHVWAITGVEPPVAANWIGLALGYVTLALGARMLLRMPLPPKVARFRIAFLLIVLLLTISNRTFLTWLSSGLETSLFNCALTYWVFAACAARGGLRIVHLASSCALLALTRPDGLLFASASLPLIADELTHQAWTPNAAPVPSALLRALACTPLLAIPAHLWFRVSTYGEWVPNTYFAKIVSSWPASGKRYVLSFALEYGVWLWAISVFAWLVVAAVRLARGRSARLELRARLLALHRVAPVVVVVATLAAHAGYYIFVVGGDHFEYRVFSHLPLLLALALVHVLAQIADRPAFVALGLTAYLAVGLPIPWVHWQHTHGITVDKLRHRLRVKIAGDFPELLRAPVQLWDETQGWLIGHAVGSRQIEHKLFAERMLRMAPPRAQGEQLTWQDRPVLAAEAVGIVSYMLPNVAIIDMHGLSDRVVARTPPPKNNFRKMAHERMPPPGYVECFAPNVRVQDGRVKVKPRKKPLLDARIEKCDSIERWVKPPKPAPR
jgi:arabinofuranosyltransferase